MKEPDVDVSGKNWLGHSEACARVDQMLLTGADMSRLLTSGRKLSAVRSHLGHLRTEHGLAISRIGGVYRFDYPEASESLVAGQPLEPNAAVSPSAVIEPRRVATVRMAEPIIGRSVPEVRNGSAQGTSSGVVGALFAEAERLIGAESIRGSSAPVRDHFVSPVRQGDGRIGDSEQPDHPGVELQRRPEAFPRSLSGSDVEVRPGIRDPVLRGG
jgi:hypothetical protein